METLRYVLLANGLLAVVSIAYYVLLRRETFFGANRLALWLGLAASLVLPLLEIPDWRPEPVRAVMQRTARVIVPRVLPNPPIAQSEVTITYSNGQTYPAFSRQQEAVHALPAVWRWLVGLYVAGALFLLIRFGIRLASLVQLIRRSTHEHYTGFTLARNESITSPFSFFNWVVLNPDYHEPDELKQILRHERVHVRERHSLDMVGAEFLCIILWFNPAAYLFRYLLHQTLEFSADRAVLAEGVDAKTYQYNLVKVSLSTGRSSLTNHFSKSQLTSRIRMLNRQESTQYTWLKYPVIGIATLTVVATFARPTVQTIKQYVPAPVAEVLVAVQAVEPIAQEQKPVERKLVKPAVDSISKPALPNRQPVLHDDSTSNESKPDSSHASPSRYMVYQGGYLYWIVTPKTTFDDLTVMKQEFAKHGHQMQLNEIKYDPLYAYIDRIVFTVVRSTGGMTQVDELDDDGKPIPTVAGYVGIGTKAGGSGTGGLRYYGKEFPDVLRTVATEDEAATTLFAKKHQIEYLLQTGSQKFQELGGGATTYYKEFFKNKSTKSSGLIVNPDGSLSVNKELGAIRVFVNNEPASPEAVHSITIDRLYALVKKSQYNPASKESFTSALLIYVNEDN
jgi:beta-lactamase regulating signal transducer with metallopeptidase domain